MQQTVGKPSNALIEDRTWQWFMGAVARHLGPAYYDEAHHPAHSDWPDIVAQRSRRTICFEITSPLSPHDVNSGKKNDSELIEETPFTLRQRVMEATARKIHRYGMRHFSQPMALLITLAHPITQRLSKGDPTAAGIDEELKTALSQELHQPFDAIYLVGPGPRARLLWRRSGAQWKRVFPELDESAKGRKRRRGVNPQ
jgi:hypothetical protein